MAVRRGLGAQPRHEGRAARVPVALRAAPGSARPGSQAQDRHEATGLSLTAMASATTSPPPRRRTGGLVPAQGATIGSPAGWRAVYARWYDPTSGRYRAVEGSSCSALGSVAHRARRNQADRDWVGAHGGVRLDFAVVGGGLIGLITPPHCSTGGRARASGSAPGRRRARLQPAPQSGASTLASTTHRAPSRRRPAERDAAFRLRHSTTSVHGAGSDRRQSAQRVA